MKEINQMLKQWFPVNTKIRDQFREMIVLYVQRKMDEAFEYGRQLENPLEFPEDYLKDDGVCNEDTIFNTETHDEMMIRVKMEDTNDGVCEGEYVHPQDPFGVAQRRNEYYESGDDITSQKEFNETVRKLKKVRPKKKEGPWQGPPFVTDI